MCSKVRCVGFGYTADSVVVTASRGTSLVILILLLSRETPINLNCFVSLLVTSTLLRVEVVRFTVSHQPGGPVDFLLTSPTRLDLPGGEALAGIALWVIETHKPPHHTRLNRGGLSHIWEHDMCLCRLLRARIVLQMSSLHMCIPWRYVLIQFVDLSTIVLSVQHYVISPRVSDITQMTLLRS